LAVLDHRQCAFDAACARYDEAIELFAQLGARRYLGAFLGYRALVSLERMQIDEAIEQLERATDLLAQVADERFGAYFGAHLDAADVFFALRASHGDEPTLARRDPGPDEALVVHSQGDWMRPPASARVELTRREPLRRLLRELSKARSDRAGAVVDRELLVKA